MTTTHQNDGKILVIEDNPDLLELFVEILTEAGFFIEACSTLETAKRLLLNGKYDALITDWSLGGKTVESILLDKEFKSHLPTVTVVLSAYAHSSLFSRELSESFFVIGKPFETSQLVDLLRTQLGHHSKVSSAL